MKKLETQTPLKDAPVNSATAYTITETPAAPVDEKSVDENFAGDKAGLRDEEELEAASVAEGEESLNTTPASRQRNIIIAAIIGVALLAGLLYWFFGRSKTTTDAAEADAATVVSVRVAKAARQPIAADVSALGTIFPREQATVSAKIGAQIRQMRLLKNQVVRAGEIIAVLESRDLQAQRAEATAALQNARAQARSVTSGAIPQANAQAEKDVRDASANVTNARALYERRRALYAQGGIALKDVEAAQLALTTAEDNLRLAERTLTLRRSAINPNDQAVAASNINQAQQRLAGVDAQLSYATIRAPISGIVTDQYQFEGEFAAPGARLVTIADISEVIVKAQFADTVVAKLKAGDPAQVLPTDLPGERMTGRVSLISRASDPLNRTVEVWVNLANGAGRLRAGGAAEVVVATEQASDAIVVPASAVTLDASNADAGTVMIVDAMNVAHETKVTIGIRTKDSVQITSGVQEGETVITQGNYALPDGTKVEINDTPSEGDGTPSSKESG
jgi:multidrug efflux pump subunit AcrA (membrane-fusion protein)